MGDMGAGGAEAGNYKGVMLCNRPSEPAGYSAPGVTHISPSMDAPSFRPVGLPAEPLGLNPAKENLVSNVLAVHDEAARRRAEAPARQGPPNFMNKHRAWLAEMAKKKAALNQELQQSALAAEDKRKKFVAYTSSLRQAVRERAAEMELEGIEHMDPDQLGVSRRHQPPPQYEEEPPPPPPPPPQAAPAPFKPPAAAKKPAWARTEEEAEEVEDAEAAMLVDFAKGAHAASNEHTIKSGEDRGLLGSRRIARLRHAAARPVLHFFSSSLLSSSSHRAPLLLLSLPLLLVSSLSLRRPGLRFLHR